MQNKKRAADRAEKFTQDQQAVRGRIFIERITCTWMANAYIAAAVNLTNRVLHNVGST